jgi:hypothetical protein
LALADIVDDRKKIAAARFASSYNIEKLPVVRPRSRLVPRRL